MVADAGEAGGLRPSVAAACVVAIALVTVVAAVNASRSELVLIAPPQKPPVELAVEARQIAADAGYGDDPADSAYQFFVDTDHLKAIKDRDSSPARWDRLRAARPAPILFWHRQSPRPLVALESSGDVSEDNPPLSVAGLVGVRLDSAGRLLRFLAAPPQFDQANGDEPKTDWSVMFRRAGLVEAAFAPVRPEWNPLVDSDERRAWTGAYPDQPDVPVRVESGSYKGKPVYFDVVAPWNKPWRQEIEPWEAGQKAVAFLGTVLLVVIVVGAALLARRNLRLGRADRRGAFRLAAFLFLLHLFRGRLLVHHVMGFEEIGVIFQRTALVLLLSALAWLIYIALEPYVRRLWPEVLISWNRLVDGRLRDPRIGRDIVAGGAAFAGLSVLAMIRDSIPRWMGVPAGVPKSFSLYFLSGARTAAAGFLELPSSALSSVLLILFLVLLLRVILRRQWAALGVVLLILTFASTAESDMPGLQWFFAALAVGTLLFVLIRFGMLACVAISLFGNFAACLSPLARFPAWYAQPFVAALLAMTTLIIYGLVLSLAGRPIFRDPILPR